MRTAKTLIRLGGCPGDAQADLSLRWAHSHFVGFVMSRLFCLQEFDLDATPITIQNNEFENEPPHDKINNVAVRPAKTQISLGILPV